MRYQYLSGDARARWIKPAIVAALWILFASMFARQWAGDSKVWDRIFGVTQMAKPFADLAQIPAAVEAKQHGLDPYLTSPYDMDHRPFVYPRVWIYLFSALRITPERIIPAGLFVACCFLSGVSWLVLRQKDLWASLFIGLAACSSTSAFAIERGNIDIIVFCLVLLAIKLESRGGLWFLILASALKIFPFFALIGEALVGRRTKILYAAVVLGAVVILAQHTDVGRPTSGAPHGYGIGEIDIAMDRATGSLHASYEAHAEIFRVGFILFLAAICGSGAAAGALWGRKRATAFYVKDDENAPGSLGPHSYSFVLCASIFAGTYLASTSRAYRLIFLIPLVPLFVSQARGASFKLLRVLGVTGLVLILFGVDRAPAENMPWHRLSEMAKVASHLDLWALLWTSCFFLGLLAATEYCANSRMGKLRERALSTTQASTVASGSRSL